MRKLFCWILVSMFLVSCEGPYIFNRVVKDSSGEKMLFGGVDRYAFENPPFAEWYRLEYDSYEVKADMVKSMRTKLKKHRIEVFMGTWCDDSKREFPRLMRILDEAKFPKERLLIYAVNESKKSFYGEEGGKDVRYVPAIIFYKGGKEVGRIVESPVSGSLEEDILMIVNEVPYTPNYFEE